MGGIQKFSLIDFPGKISAVIFTQGCNFRCRYCHNSELCRPLENQKAVSLENIFDFLESRRGKLEAVTITGGEPTIHPDLLRVIKKIKKLGFLTKLDTNGSNPRVLRSAIKQRLLDYIAMDIKAPLDQYKKIMGWSISPEILKESIDLIIKSGVAHEFRTTIVKSLTTKDNLCEIARIINGAEIYYLQKFIPSDKINDSKLLNSVSYSDEELQQLSRRFVEFVKNCRIR